VVRPVRGGPVRDWLRWWFYRRRWKAAMTLAGLAPDYRVQPVLPVLGGVHRAGAVDLVRAGLVTGQAPADFEARAENLAHTRAMTTCNGARPHSPRSTRSLRTVRNCETAGPRPKSQALGDPWQ
jgi:hypothetical protein